MDCRQEVVPGHRAAGLTLEQQFAGDLPPAKLELVLVPGGQAEVNRWKHSKNVSLHHGNEDV
jgi:hypothetical protein